MQRKRPDFQGLDPYLSAVTLTKLVCQKQRKQNNNVLFTQSKPEFWRRFEVFFLPGLQCSSDLPAEGNFMQRSIVL